MGMTITQKILAQHAGLQEVRSGDLIEAGLDWCLGNEVTTPPAIKIFRQLGAESVFDKDRVCLVQDHFTPNKDIKSAELCKTMRCFAHEQAISHFYELGRKEMGIEHVILPDNGIVFPGDAVIGAFSTGVGSTDLACAMASGSTWFKIPEAIKVVLHGEFGKYVTGKDLILHLIGMIGVDGALYKSLEFTGDGVKNISMTGRLTICNMAIECGAKNGIFPVDDITLEYISKTNPERYAAGDYKVYQADDDAEYEKVIEIDLAEVPPRNPERIDVSVDDDDPELPEIRLPISELRGDVLPPDVTCPATSMEAKSFMHSAYSESIPIASYVTTALSTFESF